MYCSKCGKELAEGEVCSCEKAAAENGVGKDIKKEFLDNAQKIVQKVKSDKKIAGIAIGAVALLVIFIAVISAFSGKGYMKPINDVVSCINNGEKNNPEALLCAGMPKSFAKVYKAGLSDYARESYKDSFDECYEDLKDELKHWKLSFEVSESEKLDGRDLRDIKDGFDDTRDEFEDIYDEVCDLDEYDIEDLADFRFDGDVKRAKNYVSEIKKITKSFTKAKITKGYTVKGRFVLTDGREKIAKTEKETLTVICFDGEWFIYSTTGNYYLEYNEDYSDVYDFMDDIINGAVGTNVFYKMFSGVIYY